MTTKRKNRSVFAKAWVWEQGLATRLQLDGTFMGMELFCTLIDVVIQLFALDKTHETAHQKVNFPDVKNYIRN